MTRIIGGTAGGRRLETPRGQTTRPTSDRVREALFSAIESRTGSLDGLRFLDLYAGSGAVGLEAWSRGAGVVTMVEQDRRTAALIARNAATLGFSRARVVATSVASFLASPPAAPYDVVFADPPYPMSDQDVDADLVRAGGPRLARAGCPGGRRTGGQAHRRHLAARPRGGPHAALRRDHALVRSRHLGPLIPRRDQSPAQPQPEGRTPVRRAVCPGSFDPVTNGHLDIVGRAARLFDEVVIAVGVNMSKNRLFTPDERIAMLREATSGIANVRVSGFDGLIVDFCREIEAVAIVKGLRGAGDYEYELPMAQMNSHLTAVETVFLPGAVGNAFVSSSLIKEVAALGGDVRGLVPEPVREQLVARLAERRA